jgi:hypothetical protein
MVVQRVSVTFHMCSQHTMIRLSPTIILPHLPPSSLHLFWHSFQCVLMCFLSTQMWYILILFTSYHSPFLSLLPLLSSNSPGIGNTFSLSLSFSV